MTDRQENQFTMCKEVNDVMQEHLTLINSIPALANDYALYERLLKYVVKEVVIQEAKIEGVTVDKVNLKYKLAHRSFIISSAVRSYASSIENNHLKQEMNYAKSTLEKSRDTKLIFDSQRIYDRAFEYETALADYGISAVVISDFRNLISTYSAEMSSPTTHRGIREVSTSNLDKLIKDLMDFLNDRLDPAMQVFDLTEAQLLKRYTVARKIINLHGPGASANTGKLKGVVKDATTLLVLEDVQIEILDTEYVVTSNGLGEYFIDLLPDSYRIRASKDDYTEQVINELVVVKGEDKIVDILLEPMV